MIDVREIKDIRMNYEGKFNHILILLKGKSQYHMKFEKPEQIQDLVTTLNFLRDFHKKTKTVLKDGNRNFKKEVHLRVRADKELRNYEKIKVIMYTLTELE